MTQEEAFVAEFTISSRQIRGSASRFPAVEMEMVDQYGDRGGQAHGIFWVNAPDYAGFEESLTASDIVAEWTLLVEGPDQRLYNITAARGGDLARLVDLSREYNVVWQRTVIQGGALRIRAIVPDREALTGFHAAIREHDYEFSLHQVTSDIDSGLAGEPSLSRRQREALVLAYERGYYEQPRQVSLAEIGEDLGISESAVSGRLCRGISTLLEEVLPVEEDDDVDATS